MGIPLRDIFYFITAILLVLLLPSTCSKLRRPGHRRASTLRRQDRADKTAGESSD